MNENQNAMRHDATTTTETDEQATAMSPPRDDDFDFQIVVKKLELPVQPRGVLAE